MVDVRARLHEDDVRWSGPSRVPDTKEGVIRWYPKAMQLSSTVIVKARKFVNHDCVQYVGDDLVMGSACTFVCLPLNGEFEYVDSDTGRVFRKIPFEQRGKKSRYNSTMYRMWKGTDNETFVCNCQGWTTKARRGEIKKGDNGCAHILALKLCFKLGRFRKAPVEHVELLSRDFEDPAGGET